VGKVIDLEEYRRRKLQEASSFERFVENTLEQVAGTLGIPKDLLKERGE
jgi:hypothetical protein